MTVTVRITDTETGATAVRTEDAWDDATEYLWTEGNLSCDHNRAEDGWPQDLPCESERYLIRVTNDAGEVLYDEAA